eukprot:6492781-Amphidinium_carterae.4
MLARVKIEQQLELKRTAPDLLRLITLLRCMAPLCEGAKPILDQCSKLRVTMLQAQTEHLITENLKGLAEKKLEMPMEALTTLMDAVRSFKTDSTEVKQQLQGAVETCFNILGSSCKAGQDVQKTQSVLEICALLQVLSSHPTNPGPGVRACHCMWGY